MPIQSWLTRRLITRAARAHGFIDPIKVLGRLRGFAEPSEVAEPLELLRAGFIFHARGLVNTKAIQTNLDWIWPYWVEQQFDPHSSSFIPRAFSFSHINLTHRNWTAVGHPGVAFYPIVDPRGLVTPHFDGWSIDLWALPVGGAPLWPSKSKRFTQEQRMDPGLSVWSRAPGAGFSIDSLVRVELEQNHPHCLIDVSIHGRFEGFLAVSFRPYNPEGISRLDTISVGSDGRRWRLNGSEDVFFNCSPLRRRLSTYREGDVAHSLDESHDARADVTCPVGLATGAALFSHEELSRELLQLKIPLHDELEPKRRITVAKPAHWTDERQKLSVFQCAEGHVRRLYEAAATSLILHAPDDVFPGPFTYKRFWFRDAAFILNALLELGGVDRVRLIMDGFAPRQRADGYFLSQDGEWDSNGEALWLFDRFSQLSGRTLPVRWMESVQKGAEWIRRKRLRGTAEAPSGLLPAGFSAEHLGPNDFYYWDDFWAVAGLRAAARLVEAERPALASDWRHEANDLLRCIEHSIPNGPHRRFPGAVPAAPGRRMDAGAIGSLVADYPLRIYPPGDARMLCTANYLYDHSTVDGAFFQSMIHSGVNAYLTLHLAQVYLRAGRVDRTWALMRRVGELASSTGHWPEAIHPRTLGGCMGDGHHVWASAEWAKLVRDCFVREEDDRLVIGSGVPSSWWANGQCSFGPTLTPYGALTVRISAEDAHLTVQVRADWRSAAPLLVFAVPGWREQSLSPAAALVEVRLGSGSPSTP